MEVRFAEVSGWILRYLLSIEISDILDIALMAFILYKIFTLVQSTKAASLVKGLMIFLAALVVSSALHLNGINYIMRSMANLGLLALIILFQPEIRRVLEQVGSRPLSRRYLFMRRLWARWKRPSVRQVLAWIRNVTDSHRRIDRF